jgi:hypothetical protein
MVKSMEQSEQASRRHTVAVWLAVTVLTSSAAILTRYGHVPATSVGFWRVGGASLVLGVLRRANRRHAREH